MNDDNVPFVLDLSRAFNVEFKTENGQNDFEPVLRDSESYKLYQSTEQDN